jgi:hypothetical protein|eukprot:COSAG02_NODE_735_length_17872_cov_20.966860_17_plen_207_part_00
MLLREIPGNFAWYGVYEGTCKALIPPGGSKKDLGPQVHLLGGALSGVTCVHITTCSPRLSETVPGASFAVYSFKCHVRFCDRYWTAFYPADTIKSYIQTDPRFSSSSIYQVGKGIYKEHGLSGLYRGWVRNAQLQSTYPHLSITTMLSRQTCRCEAWHVARWYRMLLLTFHTRALRHPLGRDGCASGPGACSNLCELRGDFVSADQ